MTWKVDFIFPLHQMHLFDIDVPRKIRFQESETLSPGSGLAKFETSRWIVKNASEVYLNLPPFSISFRVVPS